MTAKYRVEGMTCGGCVKSVQNALAALDKEVKVDLESGTAELSEEVAEATIKETVEDLGFVFGGRAS